MKPMKVAQFGLIFTPEKELNELTFNLPLDTEILSVSVKKEKGKHVTWFTYLFPSAAYNRHSVLDDYPWRKFHFFIVKCNYTDINIDKHKYIGIIDIKDSTYAVFYKVGEIIKK